MVSEMRGFVFSIVFIVVFSTLLVTIPSGLYGADLTAESVIPLDPTLLTGFDETANYTKSAFDPTYYAYSLGTRDWAVAWLPLGDDVFSIFAYVYWMGVLWFGQIDPCKFVSDEGIDRGSALAISEIYADSSDGSVRYSMTFTTTGEDAGSFLVYWNETLNADPQDAHDNDVLYLLHGIGFSATATNDIGSLLVGLLFLQLPDVPVLVNMFIVVPIWACIIFVLWFVMKEMIPFLG